MSKLTICDIKDCMKEGSSYDLQYLDITVVPTGNSDYSSTMQEEILANNFDLCEDHALEYDKRMAKVLVKSDKGLYFPDEPKQS